MTTPPTAGFFASFLARLRFPQLFTLLLVLFFADLLMPDLIPFVDEILLGGLTALIGLWRKGQPAGATVPPPAPLTEKPPTKNITPPRP